MSSAELSQPPPAPVEVGPTTPPPTPGRQRVLALAALAVLVGFIALEAPILYGEWKALQEDQLQDHLTRVIGYPGINPLPNQANKPANWFHHEGGQTLLWSGWTPGVGHTWFRVGRGEIAADRLVGPFCRDVVRAIDWPIVEVGGGKHWDQIPPEVAVVGLEWRGKALAYPRLVLEKVEVVNDTIDDAPLLLAFIPFVEPDRSVRVIDPTLDGRRITLGSSGYLHDKRPLLYDRGTESLWLAEDEGIAAVAGRHKGRRLPPVARPILTTWGDWSARYPKARLVVGADRTRGMPNL